MMCDGDMMGWMGVMGLFWLLLIAGGIALVIWAITRTVGGRGADRAADDRALATLRERFARGEIDEAEYRQRRQALETE